MLKQIGQLGVKHGMKHSENDTDDIDDNLRHNKADRMIQMSQQMDPKSEKSVESSSLDFDSVNEVIGKRRLSLSLQTEVAQWHLR